MYLVQLAERLSEKGIAVSLFAPFKDAIRRVAISEAPCGCSRFLGISKPMKVFVVNKLILDSSEIFEDFDIIHSISWSSIASFHLLSKRAKRKRLSTSFIFDCRTSLFNINRSYNIYKLAVLSLFKPSYLIFCDKMSFRKYADIFSCERIKYIPTPVDTQKFMKKSKRRSNDKFRILFASSLRKEKGLLDLLQAVEGIANQHSEVELVVAGDGPLRDYVLDLETKRSWLRYVGMVTHSQMPSLLNCVDLLVHPSLFEGISHTVLEGLACEVPVVATDVGGHFILKDVVRLIPPSCPRKMSKEILYMMENEDVMDDYSHEGRKYVTENNSWDKAIQQMICIYETLTENPAK